jgi:serine/threonine-protein kinase
MIGRVPGDTYRVERLIGKGAMGAVYEVTHLRLGRRFALKMLHEELAADAVALSRFEREARTAGALGHPNIVDVVDFNATPDGASYLVMELLEGEDLATRLGREPRLPLAEAVAIVGQVASALEAAHQRGVVHRDLKPENILLARGQGDATVVKVLDFGISKVLGAASKLTGTDALLGTPEYMSPEQAEERSGEVDARSDIFSLGAIAYRLLAGTEPFAARSVPSLLYKVAYVEPAPLRELRPDLPAAVSEAIARAMRKRPEDRFASARELADSLSRVAADAAAAPPAAHEEEETHVRARPVAPAPPLVASGAPEEATQVQARRVAPARGRPTVVATIAALLVLALAAGLFAVLAGTPVPDGGDSAASGRAPDGAPAPAARDAALGEAERRVAAMVPVDGGASAGTPEAATARPRLGSLRIAARDERDLPLAALVIVDGKPAGHAPLELTRLSTGRTLEIRIEADGYRPALRRYRVRAGQRLLAVKLTSVADGARKR